LLQIRARIELDCHSLISDVWRPRPELKG